MADRILLEAGVDGYLLEDGSGVMLLETQPAMSSYEASIRSESSLVSYWRLGESSGTTAYDEWSANDGTYTGGYTLAQAGLLTGDTDTAVLLDGTSGYVRTGTVGFPTGATARTFIAWIKTNLAARGNIFSYGNDGVTHASFGIATTGPVLEVWTYADDPTKSAPGLSDSSRHMVAAVYDGNVTISFYMDGAWLGDATLTGVLNTNTATITHADMGKNHFNNANRWRDVVDEVAIFGAALSAARVLAHYRAGVKPRYIPFQKTNQAIARAVL